MAILTYNGQPLDCGGFITGLTAINKSWNYDTAPFLTVKGRDVWTDGTNIYYSNGALSQYKINVATSSWSWKTWTGYDNFGGEYIWHQGSNTYSSQNSSSQYRLNTSTGAWEAKTWNNHQPTGIDIWTDGTNVYDSSFGSNYTLDVSTSTWTARTWYGTSSFSGRNVWTDGTNFYLSEGSIQKKLQSAYSWQNWGWFGLTNFNGQDVWTGPDGNFYYSDNASHYVLDIATKTWSSVTAFGVNFYGRDVWSGGGHVYVSNTYEIVPLSQGGNNFISYES